MAGPAENFDKYWAHLHDQVFPGYLAVELLRRKHDDEIEFITIMTIESTHIFLSGNPVPGQGGIVNQVCTW